MRRLGAINMMSVGIFGAAVVLFVYLILIRPTLPGNQVGQDQVTATVDVATVEATAAPTDVPTITAMPTQTALAASERIAFVSTRDGDESLEIYTMNPDGSDVERLTYTQKYNLPMEWSDDGEMLMYISGLEEHLCVSLIGQHGGSPIELYELTDFDAFFYDIDAALGSRKVAYVNENYELYLASPDMPSVLISDTVLASEGWNLVLSEDGRALAFVDGHYQLQVVYLDNVAEVRSVSHDAFSIMGTPAWSPDGALIAFSGQPADSEDMYLYVGAPRENTTFRQVTFEHMYIHQVSWSPDGKYLAFYADDEDGTTGLYVVRPDGSDLRRIATLTDPLSMSWSPDSRFIAVDTVLEAVADYYNIQVVAVDGSGTITLTEEEHDNALPIWSPRP